MTYFTNAVPCLSPDPAPKTHPNCYHKDIYGLISEPSEQAAILLITRKAASSSTSCHINRDDRMVSLHQSLWPDGSPT
jgi:hypothetical protein